jgi:hypothetical protein
MLYVNIAIAIIINEKEMQLFANKTTQQARQAKDSGIF